VREWIYDGGPRWPCRQLQFAEHQTRGVRCARLLPNIATVVERTRLGFLGLTLDRSRILARANAFQRNLLTVIETNFTDKKLIVARHVGEHMATGLPGRK
jgi:hypothetical protein